MKELKRREILKLGLGISLLASLGTLALTGCHVVQPQPFNTAKLSPLHWVASSCWHGSRHRLGRGTADDQPL